MDSYFLIPALYIAKAKHYLKMVGAHVSPSLTAKDGAFVY